MITGGVSALKMAPQIARNIKKIFAGADTLINPAKKTEPFSIFNIKGETPIRKNMEKNTRRVTVFDRGIKGGGKKQKTIDVPLQHLDFRADRAHPIYRIKDNPFIRKQYYKSALRDEQVTELVDKPFVQKLAKEYGDQEFMGIPINRLKDKTVKRAMNLNRERVSKELGFKISPLTAKSSVGYKINTLLPDLVRERGREITRGRIKQVMTLKEFLESTDPKTKRPLWETIQNKELVADPRFKGIRETKFRGIVEDAQDADTAGIAELRNKWKYKPLINRYGKKHGYRADYISFAPTGLTKRALRLFSYQKGAGQKQTDLIASKAKRSEFMINFVLDKLSPRQRKVAMKGFVNRKQSFLQALHEAARRDDSVSDKLKRPQAVSTWYRNLRHFGAESRIKELLAEQKITKDKGRLFEIDLELAGWDDDMMKLGLQSEIDGVTYGKWYDTKSGILKPLVKDLEREYPFKEMTFYGEKYKRLGEAEGGLINEHLTDTIPPKRGPMPQGLPLLDPLESIERSQRQHFPIGGAVGAGKLWGALSKVPRAVARFGDIKKPKLTKPTATTELSVAQAVEDKPAMFLESVKVIEDAPDSANLTADEWMGYVKNKNVSETELDEFGLGPMLKNLAGKDTTVDAADLKAAQEVVKKTKESGIGINKQFSDIMKKHKGDFSNPEVIAIKEKLDIYKAALKGDMDILSRLEGAGKVRIPKAKLIEMYDMEMPKIDMDIAIAEPVSRGASDIVGMLLKVRERGRGSRWDEATEADIFSSDARLLSQLHQPPQDRVGFVLRNKLIDVMKGTTKVVPRADDDPLVHHLLKPEGKQHYHFERGTHFKEMWETAFPNLFHTTNQIVKQGHFEDLKHLVKAEDIAELAKAKGIPEEDAFKQLYQALNIFDRSIMTADVPIPFWTKKLLYRLGDMDQGRGFFYKSKRSPAHEGTQFIPGGSGYGELKFYQNFTPGSVRAAEGQYKSGHFSGEVFQGNTGNSPFMWTRFSERIDESGRKLLLGEEIQSDLHQNVAQKGYAYAPRLDKHDVLAEMGEFAKQLDTKAQTLESTRLRKDTIKALPRHERESPANVAELKNIERAIKKLIKDVKTLKAKVAAQAKRTGTSGQVHPDTAFKKSENYAKLAMQGLMKMASDKGYDGVALSTGRMKKTYGNIPKGGDKFYDEIGVKAMERMAKKSGYKISYTTIVDGNGYSWEKVPVILMRDVNTGKKLAGDATIPVYKKGGIVNKKMVKK
jgi:hypothetical protein